MPRRVQDRPRPGFTFINSCHGTGSPESRLLARRHASYWGHRKSRASDNFPFPRFQQPSSSSPATDSSSTTDEPLEQEFDIASTVSLDRISTAAMDFYDTPVIPRFGSGFDSFQSLPQVGTNSERVQSELFPLNPIMLEFFGESFINHTMLRSGETCNNRYAACLLLSYAYCMALTGAGSYDFFMWLKGEVIQKVREALTDPSESTTLDTMIAVMALGTPMICQFTDTGSRDAEHPECVTSAASGEKNHYQKSDGWAKNASNEYDMHYQAVTRLLRMQPDPAFITTPDGRFVFLVKVISNAHRMLTLYDIKTEAWVKLFQKFDLYLTDSHPDSCWGSPLCGPSHLLRSRPSNSHYENLCIELAGAMRLWFLEFKKSCRRAPNQLDFVRGRLEHLLRRNLALEDHGTTNDGSIAMYDSCVIASMIMTEAADRGCPLSSTACFTPRAAQLPCLLRKTDLLHLWGGLRGLLYWVTLVCHTVATNNEQRKTSTLILAHFTQSFAASEIPLSAALTPIKELLEYPSN